MAAGEARTGMDTFGRLANLQLVQDGDVRTYLAIDPETGAHVLLHLRRTELLDREFNRKLRKWLEAEPAELLDRGEYDGLIYVVTEIAGPWRGLSQTINEFAATSARAVAPPSEQDATVLNEVVRSVAPPQSGTAAPEQRGEPGEFTRMFAIPANETPRPAAPAEVKGTPGEFTQMFAGQPAQQAGQATEKPVPAVKEPGEFTRMFGVPSSEPPSSPKEAAPQAKLDVQPIADPEKTRLFPATPAEAPPRSGSFTQLFRAPAKSPSTSEAGQGSLMGFGDGPYAGREVDFRNLPAAPSQASAPSNRPAGEFTQMFGNPGARVQGTAAPAGSTGGGATGLFNAQGRAAAQQPVSTMGGPGEYTRMFAGQPTPETGSAQTGQPPQATPKSGDPKNFLIVAAGILLLLGAALVLILVLRR